MGIFDIRYGIMDLYYVYRSWIAIVPNPACVVNPIYTYMTLLVDTCYLDALPTDPAVIPPCSVGCRQLRIDHLSCHIQYPVYALSNHLAVTSNDCLLFLLVRTPPRLRFAPKML